MRDSCTGKTKILKLRKYNLHCFAVEAARKWCGKQQLVLSEPVCLGMSVLVCLPVLVGQDTDEHAQDDIRTNTPMMSTMHSSRLHIQHRERLLPKPYSLFNLKKKIKGPKLVERINPAAILRFARSLHNALAPLVQADFLGRTAQGRFLDPAC